MELGLPSGVCLDTAVLTLGTTSTWQRRRTKADTVEGGEAAVADPDDVGGVLDESCAGCPDLMWFALSQPDGRNQGPLQTDRKGQGWQGGQTVMGWFGEVITYLYDKRSSTYKE